MTPVKTQVVLIHRAGDSPSLIRLDSPSMDPYGSPLSEKVRLFTPQSSYLMYFLRRYGWIHMVYMIIYIYMYVSITVKLDVIGLIDQLG